jgi:general secretion pathway protein G
MAAQGLIATAVALGVVATNQDRIQQFYEEVVAETQRIATAGDMRSISTMLDAGYLKTGRYPKDDRFQTWLEAKFKENSLRDISQDAWETPFRYRSEEAQRGFTLESAGPDKEFGTKDDMKQSGP